MGTEVLFRLDSYHIEGGWPLVGQAAPKGAKNAALPILAAAAAVGDVCRITNCPKLSDVRAMFSILRALGCMVSEEGDGVLIDSRNLSSERIPADLMKEMRSSVFLMGPLLSRLGEVSLCSPGGCEIGRRPIDIHLWGLGRLGAVIREEGDLLHCEGRNLLAAEICLPFPSVGATENLMMAALGAEGCTCIRNAAKEPEIVDLQNFLNACGACIRGGGTSVITIVGKRPLHGTEYRVMPDRIEGGTLLAAAAATGGEILLDGLESSLLASALDVLELSGCRLRKAPDHIYLKAPERLKGTGLVTTGPWPGFPTDLQSQFLVMLTLAEGESLIRETIFENRFKPVSQLLKMGADIQVSGCDAQIMGVPFLKGASVTAGDLRGGASLVLAGLCAEGHTIVEQISHIDRGYENLEGTITSLGGRIRRVRG